MAYLFKLLPLGKLKAPVCAHAQSILIIWHVLAASGLLHQITSFSVNADQQSAFLQLTFDRSRAQQVLCYMLQVSSVATEKACGNLAAEKPPVRYQLNITKVLSFVRG